MSAPAKTVTPDVQAALDKVRSCNFEITAALNALKAAKAAKKAASLELQAALSKSPMADGSEPPATVKNSKKPRRARGPRGGSGEQKEESKEGAAATAENESASKKSEEKKKVAVRKDREPLKPFEELAPEMQKAITVLRDAKAALVEAIKKSNGTRDDAAVLKCIAEKKEAIKNLNAVRASSK